MQDPVAVRNFLALKKKSYEIKFDLESTDYEAIENIGSGAYGVVCSAVHKKTKEKFAIKKIPNIFEQMTIAKRTYREIKILKHFKHDNIISIYEILGPTEATSPMNDIYIVLDLMESDLHRIIHSHQELTEEHLKYFLFQLLRGLKYIHSANVLHRDLKPSNLLVNENCELKIGDFGMARGVSTQPDSYNYSMTLYVATRWYRAPELLMLRQSYTGAVDMWSVGCIFAEMLTRKQLFPGHDYIHQLKLIFGALGRPSETFLSLAPQGIVKDFLKGIGPKTAVSTETMFPKASRKARDLLSQMLTVDAVERITVTKALNHPFLSKYHDPDDEPVCIPVFDFEFEKQELNGEQLREAIVREIKDYHQATGPLLTFDLHPVVSLDSQVTAPAGSISVPTGSMPLAVAGGSLPLSTGNLPMRDIQGLARFSCAKTSSMCEREDKPSHLQLEATRVITDVEMLSGKLLELNMQDESRPGATCSRAAELRVCGDAPDLRDVIMLSAKAMAESGKGKVCPVDTKALIKAALLNAEQRRQQYESGKSSESGRPVTAMQRQREREEKRRRKMEKAKEKRKQKKHKDKKAALVLTDEDRSLLERWQSMQHRDQSSEKTRETTVPGGVSRTEVTGPDTAVISQTVSDTAVLTRDSFHTALSDQLHQHLVNMALGLDTLHHKEPVIPSLADRKSQVTSQVVDAPIDHTRVTEAVIATTGHNHLPTYHEAVQAKLCGHIKTTTLTEQSSDSNNAQFLSLAAGAFTHTLPPGGTIPSSCDKVESRVAAPDNKTVGELPTLACTPKGTGSGYGVGLDLDGLLHDAMAEQKDREREGLDSAPLSASLIADWLEVSGNMNIHDIEAALQQELEIPSPILTHISP